MNYRLLLSTVIFMLPSLVSLAQSEQEEKKKRRIDSLTLEGMSEYAKKYPLIRQGSFGMDFFGRGHVKAELKGQPLFEGEEKVTRIRSNFNVPISTWGKNRITASVSYQQQRYQVNQITSNSPLFNQTNIDMTKAAVGFTASYSRTDSLFNRPVSFSASISGLTDELTSIKRLNYIGTVIVPLKRTANTMLSAGLVVILDPSSPVPAFVIFNYWHKFQENDLELFLDLPSRLALRKQFSKRSWVSAGTEIASSMVFFDLTNPSLPQNSLYTTFELQTGLKYEHMITKKLVFGIGGGMMTTINSRMFGRNDSSNDYFFKSRNATVPYASFSISFLPFLKSLK